MERRYAITCDEDRARRIETLAREYDLTAQEVLHQLVSLGLEEVETRENGRVARGEGGTPPEERGAFPEEDGATGEEDGAAREDGRTTSEED